MLTANDLKLHNVGGFWKFALFLQYYLDFNVFLRFSLKMRLSYLKRTRHY